MNNRSKPSLMWAWLILIFISITVYFVSRTVFVLYAQYGYFEKTLAVLFLLSETFVMFHAIGFFSDIARLNRKHPEEIKIPQLKEYPSVAILVPARHEPKDVLENTFTCLYNIDYPNKQIYFLDDSSEEKFVKEAEEIAKKYNAVIFRRKIRHGAKAGIINDCVKNLDAKYVVVFDADQNPIPSFVSKLVPIMESNPRLALVQTPQFYTNMDSSRVSYAANMQQSVFYEYICEAKSYNQAMICCGTNVMLRREALLDVGGLDESTVTEDFATSVALHSRGWETIYYNHVYTFGMGPEDLGSYFKQQNRWAMGNVGVLRKILWKFITKPASLRPVQWFEYLITGSYFLIGWAYIFLLLCPIVFIVFGIPSFFMNPVIYGLSFTPYFALSIAIFYTSMIARNYKIPQLLKGQLIFFITLPVYIRAAFYGLLGVRAKFDVTAKSGSHCVPYRVLWPEMAFWTIHLIAITWGINKFVYEQSIAIAINVLWIIYHFALFSGIFYFNEE